MHLLFRKKVCYVPICLPSHTNTNSGIHTELIYCLLGGRSIAAALRYPCRNARIAQAYMHKHMHACRCIYLSTSITVRLRGYKCSIALVTQASTRNHTRCWSMYTSDCMHIYTKQYSQVPSHQNQHISVVYEQTPHPCCKHSARHAHIIYT
jgi:hypothetical protein